MKCIYLRVSREDLDESTQLPVILKHFNINENECLIFRERISAYLEESQKDRTEFIILKNKINNNEISDLYVYSLERLERNMSRLMEFFFFCEDHNCKIHSVQQPSLDLPFEDSPTGNLNKRMQLLIFGFTAENESYMTSQRTKKATVKISGLTTSYKGNKWGKSIFYNTGNKVEPDVELNLLIDVQIKQKLNWSQKRIIEYINKEYNVKLQKTYLSKHKQNGNDTTDRRN